MNKVILIGRLCSDVEVRRTNSGKAVASYRLAVDRQYKQDGQPDADFLNCVAFDKNGEFAGNYLSKGMKIAVEGRIQTRSYEDKDGKKIYVTEIIVDRHEFCEKKGESSNGNNVPNYAPSNCHGHPNGGNYGGYSAPASFAHPSAPAQDFAEIEYDGEQLPFL